MSNPRQIKSLILEREGQIVQATKYVALLKRDLAKAKKRLLKSANRESKEENRA
jgi:hypothetical protein